MRLSGFIGALIVGASLAGLGGCSTLPSSISGEYPNSADVYTPGQTQQVDNVQLGTIIDVRAVRIDASEPQKGTGSALGAAAGALLGHVVGGGRGREVATVAGTLVGAVGGNVVAQHAYSQPGLAISVRLDDGRVVSVSQAADVNLRVGERVELVGGGYNAPARVVPLS